MLGGGYSNEFKYVCVSTWMCCSIMYTNYKEVQHCCAKRQLPSGHNSVVVLVR